VADDEIIPLRLDHLQDGIVPIQKVVVPGQLVPLSIGEGQREVVKTGIQQFMIDRFSHGTFLFSDGGSTTPGRSYAPH
jgi:hypothetical protein